MKGISKGELTSNTEKHAGETDLPSQVLQFTLTLRNEGAKINIININITKTKSNEKKSSVYC